MAYIRKTYRFKNSIEIEEYHNGRYGAPGEKRLQRKKATPEQIKKQNQTNREKEARRKIEANFEEGDCWSTLTYRQKERPPDFGSALDDFGKFRRKIRREYKKRGYELKWMALSEYGSRGGVHHHFLLNRIPDTDLLLAKHWTRGAPVTTLIYEEGRYKKLAEYLTKETNEKNKLKDKNYSCSRNLIKIEPEKDIVLNRSIEKEPKNRKGYYVDKESIVEGINPVTGYKYRHYALIRLNRRI
ncbi:MAG: hypothetical protein PHX08_01165 [Lachnospiraceae bacterium]|nr:hypothetical protein [Lachnospiraceae bacterium]